MCCRDLVENKEVMGASIRPGTRQIMKLIKWLSRDDGRMGRWRKGGKVGGFKYVQTTFKYLVKPVNLLSRGQYGSRPSLLSDMSTHIGLLRVSLGSCLRRQG